MNARIILAVVTTLLLGAEQSLAQNNRIWSTYYGGSDSEYHYTGLAIDPSSNVYMSSTTNSGSGISFNGFQNTQPGNDDALLVKFDGAGNRLWATYYGGSGGDEGVATATDATGSVYLAGYTTSQTGIASNGFQNTYAGSTDGYLVKFDASGNRLWATYYGGPGIDYVQDVHVDVSGNIYLAGFTSSTSAIASGGHQNTFGGGGYDFFLVKFNSTGALLWATYYGGSGFEEKGFLGSDGSGNVFLVGRTSSTNSSVMTTSGAFQTWHGGGYFDSFIVKFNSNGIRQWATYYGDNGSDGLSGVDCDAAGNVYTSGWTDSPSNISFNGFQNTLAGLQDAYIAKFDPQGTRLWATYYGGSAFDTFWGLDVDNSGYAYVSGYTDSNSGIASSGFQNSYTPFVTDGMLVLFDPSGNRLCATYYGDTNYDHFYEVVTNGSGVVYAAGPTQSLTGIASGGFQNTYTGVGGDMMLVKFTTCNAINVTTSITGVSCFGGCNGTASANVTGGVPPFSYSWNATPAQTTQNAVGLCAGTYTLTITDATSSTTTATVQISEPPLLQISTASTPEFCNAFDGTANVIANGGIPGYTYQWSNGATTDSIGNLQAGVYSVVVTDVNGCTAQQSTTVAVTGAGPANAGPNVVINLGSSTMLNGTGGGTYSWSPMVNLSCSVCQNPIASPTVTTTYTLTVTDSIGCTDTAAVTVYVETPCHMPFVPNAFSPNDDGQNDILFVRGDCIAEFNFQVYSRWGEKVFETSDLALGWNGVWNGQKCEPAVFTYVLTGTLTTGELFESGGNVSLLR